VKEVNKRGSVLLYALLIIYVLFEMGISFEQHKNQPLEGDLANIVVPSNAYKVVLQNPLGLEVLLNDSVYANPNRFFAHYSTYLFFQHIPILFQKYAGIEPIDSIYISTAFAKTLIQVFILYFLSAYISLTLNPFRKKFILSAAIIAPLFQTYGYNVVMGIIDPSISYTFFYAFSFGFLLWFFYPIFKMVHEERNDISIHWFLLLLVLSFIVSFNSALNPAVVLIVTLLFFGYFLYQRMVRQNLTLNIKFFNLILKQLPKRATIMLFFISVLSLYSLYIGMNNSENLWYTIPVIERYYKLPLGLFSLFTQKLGPSVLLSALIINYVLVNKRKAKYRDDNLRWVFQIVVVVSVLYLLLLPLGGYRPYRELIIRRDTFLPIWLGMIILYGYSSIYLIQNLKGFYRKIYMVLVVIISLAFFNADLSVPNKNKCEKDALKIIAESDKKVVELPEYCNVLSWIPITTAQESAINIELLQLWNVVYDDKLYYYPSEKKFQDYAKP